MANPRFILRFTGKEAALPAAQLARLKKAPGVRVVDKSTRSLLVESPDAATLEGLVDPAKWIIQAERMVQRPDPRPRAKKPPPAKPPRKKPS